MDYHLSKFAVVGDPITHSKSPQIHAAFAAQFGIDLEYHALVPDGVFDVFIETLQQRGYVGLNITAPFKRNAYMLCEILSTNAAISNSVNTLTLGPTLIGHNTDGIGLVRDLESNLGLDLSDKNVLLLGTGGAARGVFNSLGTCKRLTIAGRSLDKVLSVTNDHTARTLDTLDTPYDLIINATSAGLLDTKLDIPDVIFGENCLAYDMSYGSDTEFMAQARQCNATVVDGLGMLVEQAAESFTLWHHQRPDTSKVIEMFRK